MRKMIILLASILVLISATSLFIAYGSRPGQDSPSNRTSDQGRNHDGEKSNGTPLWTVTFHLTCLDRSVCLRENGLGLGSIQGKAVFNAEGTAHARVVTRTLEANGSSTTSVEVDNITSWRIGNGESLVPKIGNETFWLVSGTNTTRTKGGVITTQALANFNTMIPATPFTADTQAIFGTISSEKISGHIRVSLANREFETRLTGSKQVPSVTTDATGTARVKVIDHGIAVQFELTVCNIENVTQAHIHVGAAGANGPVILWLYGPNAEKFSSHGCSELSEGVLMPDDLVPNPAAGINTWSDFLTALTSGKTYVNVHTTSHPMGEIRGQLIPGVNGEHEHEEQHESCDCECNDEG